MLPSVFLRSVRCPNTIRVFGELRVRPPYKAIRTVLSVRPVEKISPRPIRAARVFVRFSNILPNLEIYLGCACATRADTRTSFSGFPISYWNSRRGGTQTQNREMMSVDCDTTPLPKSHLDLKMVYS